MLIFSWSKYFTWKIYPSKIITIVMGFVWTSKIYTTPLSFAWWKTQPSLKMDDSASFLPKLWRRVMTSSTKQRTSFWSPICYVISCLTTWEKAFITQQVMPHKREHFQLHLVREKVRASRHSHLTLNFKFSRRLSQYSSSKVKQMASLRLTLKAIKSFTRSWRVGWPLKRGWNMFDFTTWREGGSLTRWSSSWRYST